ncbi:MAG: ATP synthase F1 subunit gamma [Bacteroidales bacterium]|nr:ATP synthase F1 subunit gamma [Bacteroidales bacterium]
MANLKEIRTRISSVKTTRQMTSAMKMVAAAKLRKAQNAITQLKPYAEKIHQITGDLLVASRGDIDNSFFAARNTKKVLLIVITSNRGLCGAFNSNVEKITLDTINDYKKQGIDANNIHLYSFGKVGDKALKRNNFNVVVSDFDIFDKLTYDYALEITLKLMEEFSKGTYDKIEIVYNSFKNAATQILTKEQFLPVQIPENSVIKGNYLYEPDFDTVLDKLVPESLTMLIYKALLDSYAAEHGARMTAMHKATDNATDLINDLTLSYNKARQAAITTEILEIVGGAEALKG